MKYHIAVANQKQGPFTLEELKNQPISSDTLVWKAGMTDWLRADQIPEINELLNAVPPPLPVAPPRVPASTLATPNPPADDKASNVAIIVVAGILLVGFVVTSLNSDKKPTGNPLPATTSTLTTPPAPKSQPVAATRAKLNVSGRDSTAELQQFCSRLSDQEIAALGLSVILTGSDFYGARVTIRNTGNVPVRVYPGNIGIHFGDEVAGIIPIDHPSFLQQCVLEPGQAASGLVMYRARVDIGVAMRLGGGGISYNDDSIQVTYER